MSIASMLVVGFLLGMKHATEADHLAAVATLVTRQPGSARAVMQGVAWGLGHTLTLVLLGGTVLVLGQSVPPRLELALEFGVALMLIALGSDVLRRLVRERLRLHAHRQRPLLTHVHVHGDARGPGRSTAGGDARPHVDVPHEHPHGLPLRALAVGTMHGLAGSAALVLLSIQAAQSWKSGLLHIVVFGLGSIAGMAMLSVAIALPLRLSAGRLGALHGSTTGLLGALSCVLGGYLAFEIVFVRGGLAG